MSDFIFRLEPGELQRFMPKGGTGDIATWYQAVGPSQWPHWGVWSAPPPGKVPTWRGDLSMGYAGPPGGGSGLCEQGETYAGSPNDACGGGIWGPTAVEVWHPV